MTASTLETVGGQEFGRCGCCRERMDAQRARDGKPCFLCETTGCRERPLRPGLRFRTVGGKVRVVIDERAAQAMDKSGRFRR